MVSEAVALQARHVDTATQVYEQIIAAFLRSTAQFLAYLDGVEPFRRQKLGAFALEHNLNFIAIKHGPENTTVFGASEETSWPGASVSNRRICPRRCATRSSVRASRCSSGWQSWKNGCCRRP